MTPASLEEAARALALCERIHDLAVQMARAIESEELDHLLALLQGRDTATEQLAATVAHLGPEEWRRVLAEEPRLGQMLATVAVHDRDSRDKLLVLLGRTRDELDGVRRGRATLAAYRFTAERKGGAVDLAG